MSLASSSSLAPFGGGAHDDARVLGGDLLQDAAQAGALGVGELAADARAAAVGDVDHVAAGEADLAGEPGTLVADRVLRDLHDDGLAGLQRLLDLARLAFQAAGVVIDLARVEHAVAALADVDERRLHAGQHVLDPAEVDVARVRRRAGAGDVVLDEHVVLEHGDLGALTGVAHDHDPVDGLPAGQELRLGDDRHPPAAGVTALAAALALGLQPGGAADPADLVVAGAARRSNPRRLRCRRPCAGGAGGYGGGGPNRPHRIRRLRTRLPRATSDSSPSAAAPSALAAGSIAATPRRRLRRPPSRPRPGTAAAAPARDGGGDAVRRPHRRLTRHRRARCRRRPRPGGHRDRPGRRSPARCAGPRTATPSESGAWKVTTGAARRRERRAGAFSLLGGPSSAAWLRRARPRLRPRPLLGDELCGGLGDGFLLGLLGRQFFGDHLGHGLFGRLGLGLQAPARASVRRRGRLGRGRADRPAGGPAAARRAAGASVGAAAAGSRRGRGPSLVSLLLVVVGSRRSSY